MVNQDKKNKLGLGLNLKGSLITQIMILIGAGVLVLFLRLYNLFEIPVFADEAIYIRWAQVMRAEATLRFLPLSDGKQPLFMWTVIPFLKLFSDPVFAGRIVSVLSGLGSFVGIFFLGKLLFQSVKVGFVASFLYAVSPFSVFFDRLALADSMLTMFGIWTLLFAVITVRKIRLDSAILSGFALGGGLLTKTPAGFFALLLPFSLVLYEWPKKFREKFIRASVFIFLFSITYMVSYGMYNILRLGPNFHMIALRNKDYVYPLSHALSSPLDPFLPFFDRSLEYFWIMGPGFFLILIVIGISAGMKVKTKETFLLLLWGLLPILVVSEFSKTMTARYIYFSLPYFFILGALGFLEFKKPVLFLKKLKIFTRIIFGSFVVYSLYSNFQLLTRVEAANLPRSERSGYLEEWTSGYGIKEASVHIKEEFYLNPNQKIVVGTEGYFGTLPDGLQIYLNDIPQIIVVGVGLPIKEVPKELSESKKSGNKTYLVVNDSRFHGDSSETDLKLISEFPKAEKPDGTRDKLLFFEVLEP